MKAHDIEVLRFLPTGARTPIVDLLEDRDRARNLACALEQENARLWALMSCGMCGGPVEQPERDEFLTRGAHLTCLADWQRGEDEQWAEVDPDVEPF